MLINEIEISLQEYGFNKLEDASRDISDATLLMKRQTLNTNRAVVVVELLKAPDDLAGYLKQLRKKVAFRCRFFPFLWGIGIQVIVICPGICQDHVKLQKHVAKYDNQWAIIQSLFLVDTDSKSLRTSRSPQQTVTAKYQDAILKVLVKEYTLKI